MYGSLAILLVTLLSGSPALAAGKTARLSCLLQLGPQAGAQDLLFRQDYPGADVEIYLAALNLTVKGADVAAIFSQDLEKMHNARVPTLRHGMTLSFKYIGQGDYGRDLLRIEIEAGVGEAAKNNVVLMDCGMSGGIGFRH